MPTETYLERLPSALDLLHCIRRQEQSKALESTRSRNTSTFLAVDVGTGTGDTAATPHAKISYGEQSLMLPKRHSVAVRTQSRILLLVYHYVIMVNRVFVGYGIDVDAVSGW